MSTNPIMINKICAQNIIPKVINYSSNCKLPAAIYNLYQLVFRSKATYQVSSIVCSEPV